MGHAMFATYQDVICRHKRMNGHCVLWLPGTDHAGIATQEKIENEMIFNNMEITKELFIHYANEWRNRTQSTIMDQLKRMGSSCDWSRQRYTMDDHYKKAVQTALDKCKKIIYTQDGQTWLDMSEYAKKLLWHIDTGNLEIIPSSETKTLKHFLENIEPWCISRQIWWGHEISQTDDVLDTWFSSALWPFATLGWPDDTDDLKKFYPANLIETADDILFFWCARMAMMGLLLTDQLPFKTIYLHGIMRDSKGRKMSKSLGNGIDPLDLIDQYGTDGIRFYLCESAMPGLDINLNFPMIESAKNFVNKLWQAGRFCHNHINHDWHKPIHYDDIDLIEKIEKAKININESLNRYRFKEATLILRNILKDEFCDIHIERSKERLFNGDMAAKSILTRAYDEILKMAHPIMPFTTERIWMTRYDTILMCQKI